MATVNVQLADMPPHPALAGGPRPRSAISRRDRIARACLVGLLLITAFDFRAADGDGGALAVQTALLVVFLGLCGYTLLRFKPRRLPANVKLVCGLATVFMTVSALAGLANGQEVSSVVRAAIPILLFTLTAYVAAVVLESMDDPGALLRPLVACGIFAAVWRCGFMFVYLGLSLNAVRWQILSGAVTFLSAYVVVALLTRPTWRDMAVAAIHSSIVLLSVTRTVIAAMIGMAGLLFALNPRLLAQRSRALILGGGVLASLLLVFSVTASGDLVFERWNERMSVRVQHGFDLTAATRVAEIEYQLGHLQDSAATLLFGHGIAAKSHYGGESAQRLSVVFGGQWVANQGSVGFGHNHYVNLLFLGGLIGGGSVLLGLIVLGRAALKVCRCCARGAGPLNTLGLAMALAMIGYLVTGLFSGLWHDRNVAAWYGLVAGCVLCFAVRVPRARGETRVTFTRARARA